MGLRATMNRTASLTVPVLMGAIVGATTLATGFFAMGAIIVTIVAIMGVVLVRILSAEQKKEEKTP